LLASLVSAGPGQGRDYVPNANYFRVTTESARIGADSARIDLAGTVHRHLVDTLSPFALGVHVEFGVRVTCRSTADSTLFTYDFTVDEVHATPELTIFNPGPSLSNPGNRLDWEIHIQFVFNPHPRCPPAHELESWESTGASLVVWPTSSACPDCGPPVAVQPGKTLAFTLVVAPPPEP